VSVSPLEPGTGRRFNLLKTLGEGSFGSVYLAEMEGAGGFKRRVALKLLNHSWAAGSDAGRRLRDEARLLGQIEHRNIVRVDDLVQLGGRWGLVMEYVSGADLERVFHWCEERGERLPPRAIAEIGAAVAAALEAAWNNPGEDGAPLHVVHRDIKPSNVRLSESGDVKVLDFGVARAAFAGREARTERVRYGSIGYMAPERLLGEADSAAGDIYGLAVLLHELVTGRLFGRAELGEERQRDQVQAARAALLAVVEAPDFADLLERCLAYSPVSRPTAREVSDALSALAPTLPGAALAVAARELLPKLALTGTDAIRGTVLEESSGRALEGAARVSSATLVVDPDARFPDPPPVQEETRSSPRWPLLLAVALGACLVVGTAGYLLSRHAGAPPGDTTGTPPIAPGPSAPTPIATPTPPVQESPASLNASPPAPTVQPPAPDPRPALPPPVAQQDGGAPARTAAPTPSAPTSRSTSRTAPAPAPPAAAEPAAPAPAETRAPPPEAAPAPAPAAPSTARLRAAKFTLAGAEGIEVTCGDVRASGATSVLLREIPPGECVVSVAGRVVRVRVDEPRGVPCTLEGADLTCR
jgi:serine/threonine-protein kinase